MTAVSFISDFCTEKKRRFGWCLPPEEIIFFFSPQRDFCVPFRMKGPVEPPTAAPCRCKVWPLFGSVMDDLERNHSYPSTSWDQNALWLGLFFVFSLSFYRWDVVPFTGSLGFLKGVRMVCLW